jgi:hypothetical protein
MTEEATPAKVRLTDGLGAASEALHAAVCQAVALLNRAPEVARCAEGREAHTLLRQALADYADAYMDQPAPEREREAVRRRHSKCKGAGACPAKGNGPCWACDI